jgi:hypothetical protein
MKRINDLEQQLNKKGASLTEKKVGKELADDMLTQEYLNLYHTLANSIP